MGDSRDFVARSLILPPEVQLGLPVEADELAHPRDVVEAGQRPQHALGGAVLLQRNARHQRT